MLNDNKTKYYYEDSHLYFWFGDHHSSEYKLFIISNNNLTIENTIGSSTEYSNAMFQEGTHLLGTNRKQKTFKRKVASEGLTLDEYKNMMSWLYEGATGFLCFDSNPYWGWTTVLEKVSDASVFYSSQGLIVEFELTWKTVGSYLATNRYYSMGIYDTPARNANYVISSGNSYGLPSFVKGPVGAAGLSSDYQIYDIFNIGNGAQYIDFVAQYEKNTQNPTFELKLIKNNAPVDYAVVEFNDLTASSIILQYYGKSNFVFANGHLAEESEYFKSSTQTQGVLTLQGPPPHEVTGTLTTEQWESLLNLGYSCIISVRFMDGPAEWGAAWYPASGETSTIYNSDLATSTVHIYSSTELSASGLVCQNTHKYYAVSSQRIAILGGGGIGNMLILGFDPEGKLNYRVLGPGSVQLTVHNYNNL